MKRLTIDIDDKKQIEKILIKLNDFFNCKIVDEIWISASKRGYHIIIYGIKAEYEDMFLAREFFGDDKWRIRIDRFKFQHTKNGLDVLWTQKGTRKARMIYNRFQKINLLPYRLKQYVEQ